MNKLQKKLLRYTLYPAWAVLLIYCALTVMSLWQIREFAREMDDKIATVIGEDAYLVFVNAVNDKRIPNSSAAPLRSGELRHNYQALTLAEKSPYLLPWEVWGYIGMSFALLLLLSLIAYRFSRKLVAPVKDLQQQIEALRRGDFAAKIEMKNHDELYFLGRTFEDMTDRLDRYITENIRLSKDINEYEQDIMAAGLIRESFFPLRHRLLMGDFEVNFPPSANDLPIGDFYDYHELGQNKLLVALGSAVGNGFGGTLQMVQLLTLLKHVLHVSSSLDELDKLFQRALSDDPTLAELKADLYFIRFDFDQGVLEYWSISYQTNMVKVKFKHHYDFSDEFGGCWKITLQSANMLNEELTTSENAVVWRRDQRRDKVSKDLWRVHHE